MDDALAASTKRKLEREKLRSASLEFLFEQEAYSLVPTVAT